MRYFGENEAGGALALLAALKELETGFNMEVDALEGCIDVADVCYNLRDDFYLHFYEIREVLKNLLSERVVAEIDRASEMENGFEKMCSRHPSV